MGCIHHHAVGAIDEDDGSRREILSNHAAKHVQRKLQNGLHTWDVCLIKLLGERDLLVLIHLIMHEA